MLGRLRGSVRRFRVVDHSMAPTLRDGALVVGVRSGRARAGQIRIFRHPHHPAVWVIKRVGAVTDDGKRFAAVADNPDAPGATDSSTFGPVKVAGSYRALRWPLRPGARLVS